MKNPNLNLLGPVVALVVIGVVRLADAEAANEEVYTRTCATVTRRVDPVYQNDGCGDKDKLRGYETTQFIHAGSKLVICKKSNGANDIKYSCQGRDDLGPPSVDVTNDGQLTDAELTIILGASTTCAATDAGTVVDANSKDSATSDGSISDAATVADAAPDAPASACPTPIMLPHAKAPASGVFMYWMLSFGSSVAGQPTTCGATVSAPAEEGQYKTQLDGFVSFPNNFPATMPTTWAFNAGPLTNPGFMQTSESFIVDSQSPNPKTLNTDITIQGHFKGAAAVGRSATVVVRMDYNAATPNVSPILTMKSVSLN